MLPYIHIPLEMYMENTIKWPLSLQNGCHAFDKKTRSQLPAGMLHLGNSPCFHPKSHLETHRQLQTSPTAKKSLPES